jgi:hypothetical protein
MSHDLELNIELFKLNSEGKLVLTAHCEVIPFLKKIRTTFKKEYLSVYAYVFYMTHESPLNPYFNYSQYEKEFKILEDLECSFDIEHPVVLKALERLREMYTLPSAMAYSTIAETLHKVASNIRNSSSIEMDQQSIKNIMTAAAGFKDLKKVFDESRRDLIIESKQAEVARVRGGAQKGYDG